MAAGKGKGKDGDRVAPDPLFDSKEDVRAADSAPTSKNEKDRRSKTPSRQQGVKRTKKENETTTTKITLWTLRR